MAILLVVLVVVLFLQTWRAAIIPLVAIPISLIGTFFFMAMFGFTLNNLSLFGLVLAVGIVVDDAIVVVENVERNIAAGLSPRDAAIKSMDEVGAALVAIALVLCAVFVPSGFITGISGQFYRQFALTIAGATVISLLVSLTLSPALCALLLKPHEHRAPRLWARPLHAFFRLFNRGFDAVAAGYGWLAVRVVRFAALMLVVYAGILAFGLNEFRKTPVGFIPPLDRGFLIVVTQLPPGAALARTDAVNRRAVELALKVPGVSSAVNVVGFSGATFTVAPNAGAIFVVLEPFAERAKEPAKSVNAITSQLYSRLAAIQEALIFVVQPPPVQGIGNAGGFRMMVEDRAGRGPQALQEAVNAMMSARAQTPELAQVFSLFEVSTPQLYLEIDRTKAQLLGVNAPDVFAALQIYIGSAYVNDFNLFGRTFRVTAQADSRYRLEPQDVLDIRVRNSSGGTVPLGIVHHRARHRRTLPRAALQSLPGGRARWRGGSGLFAGTGDRRNGQARGRNPARRLQLRMDDACVPAAARRQHRRCSPSCWRWSSCFWCWPRSSRASPCRLAVIMIVPMCLVASISGVVLRGLDNNILTQVGFMVLIGLAAKNAILIVEFAKQLEDQGRDRWAAAVEAARLRFRPILMTSLAFIFGVSPLVWAVGAGAELRQTLGTAVFSGMIGVTLFGLIFTPAFYVVSRFIAQKLGRRQPTLQAPPAPAE